MHSSLRKKYIGNAAFYKMALAVAVPIMIQNGITNFVSLLDNIMVGRVGTEQMTGVAIVNQLIFVFNLAIFGAVSGAGIFGAQYYGKGDWDGVRQTFRFKLLVCTALTVLGAGIFLLFGEDLILLYLKGDGSPEQIAASLGYAKEYLLIMLVGFIPFTLSQCYSGTLRETGQTVVPMVAGVVSVVVNLCFNTLLIFGYLGFPRLGASGAAIATVEDGADGAPGENGVDGKPGAAGADGAKGADGITPHIGDNGNWYIGDDDTGKPSRGEQGPGAEVFYIDLAGKYPSYTCPVAMADIKAAYEAGKELKCRFAMGVYTAVLPLFLPKPSANTWLFSGAGALSAMGFPAQTMTIAIVNGTVQASDTRLASMDDIPTALKNPNALTIKIGGTTVTYDGSAAKTVTIADGSEVSY